MKSAANSIIK